MQPRLSTGVTAFGALLMFVGACLLISAMGKNSDHDLLGLGLCLFSVGSLMIASGIYLKASALKSELASGGQKKESPAARKVRAGCEICAIEAPVVQCRKHELHLCGSCLAQHYDFRSCVYVPSNRRTSNKAGKAQAAKASWA